MCKCVCVCMYVYVCVCVRMCTYINIVCIRACVGVWVCDYDRVDKGSTKKWTNSSKYVCSMSCYYVYLC